MMITRRRYMKPVAPIGYKWITFSELASYPSPGKIPIYAHACIGRVGYLSSCRIALTYSSNENVVRSWSNYPYKPTLLVEGYESPARFAFRIEGGYDSGWQRYSDYADVNGTSLRAYFNNEASRLVTADIYGPGVVYLWGYQKNAPMGEYYALIQDI